MRTLLGLPSVGQGLCGGTCSEEHAWGEQGGHQGTQARNAGQVGLNMALAVMKKTPTLLMNCEAGSGTRLGLPIAWKFPEWTMEAWKLGGQAQDPIKNSVKK